jgi:2-polyprenyl-6-hydroxyphenyl methylase/3-demethylubiquinone-9 3-methyltransferase
MGRSATEKEIAAGARFAFGANWTRFLESLNEDRIRIAEESLRRMLRKDSLAGLRFVDIGSGSGLFSLAARRLGATVHSFDYDPQSVACGIELRRRFFPDDPAWTVEQGSALDPKYLRTLGLFDIVYSWGVLHHTGDMWLALENAIPLVKQGGLLFISIYNDQGTQSRRWLAVKKCYNRLPSPLRFLVVWPSAVYAWWRPSLRDLLTWQPFQTWRQYRKNRGMSPWRDVIDWVGGYPFEVAKPEEIFHFYRDRGFQLEELTTAGGSVGCNEFVFSRRS